MRSFKFVIVLSILSLLSCVEVPQPFEKIPPGIWRAEFQLGEQVTLPFNFESSYSEEGILEIEILNATERIMVGDVSWGKTKDYRDSILISFPLMDSYIDADYKENVMEGYWHVNYRGDYNIPFVAYHGQGHRFTTGNEDPITNVTGKWEATFEVETDDSYPAIGEFEQSGNNLTGTFLTETGDYRYLEGTVQGDQLMLSCFDGGHAFLFTATISQTEVLSGKFYSGKHYETNWVAGRNEQASLTNPYQLSQITTPDKRIDFTLPNSEGDQISLTDNKYNGKAKLITIMGTWCPNCLDESKFLLDYVNNHSNQNLEIIALAFEKYRESGKALSTIKNYKERLNIPYEILHAGYYDKEEATENLQWIDKIISYPTLLFVDPSNQVKRVHTGFAGPATSEWTHFQEEFEESVESILK